jgi:hypothetical protein
MLNSLLLDNSIEYHYYFRRDQDVEWWSLPPFILSIALNCFDCLRKTLAMLFLWEMLC